MPRLSLAILAALLAVAACAAGGGANGTGPAGPSASPGDRSEEPGTSGGAALPASIIDPIVADAAARLGVDPSAVKIVAAKTETFGDSSLGCPQPGVMYTQALVDGHQVIVEVNGTQLDYRGSAPGQFRICENP